MAEMTEAAWSRLLAMMRDGTVVPVVADTAPLEFKTIAEGLVHLRRDPRKITEDAMPGSLYFADSERMTFWFVRQTPLGVYGALQRVRLERTATGYRQLYTILCETSADWCQQLSEFQTEFLRKNPLPRPLPQR